MKDVCEYNPCFNEGSCISVDDTTGDYLCICPAPYIGSSCESHICDVLPECYNGGSCTFNGTCMCPEGHTGQYCELGPCDGVVCLHQGSCINGFCMCSSNRYTGQCYANLIMLFNF